MLRLIFGFLSGPLTRITGQLIDAKVELAKAETAERKIELETQVSQLEARERVLIAEQGSWMTWWIRPAVAFPIVVLIWKLVLWDTVLGWGVTPDPGDTVNWLLLTVVGAYFLTRPFEKRR